MIPSQKVCVSISGDFITCLQQLSSAPLVEIRLDLCSLNNTERLELYRRAGKGSFIVTCRTDHSTAIPLLEEAILNGATCIDIDVRQPKFMIDHLKEVARKHDCKLLLSYHNFDTTPTKKELLEIIYEMKMLEGDYMKVCTFVRTERDNSKLLSLYDHTDNLIAFGMGDLGRISRLAATFCGAPFTYVSPNSKNNTAPGQLTKQELLAASTPLRSKYERALLEH